MNKMSYMIKMFPKNMDVRLDYKYVNTVATLKTTVITSNVTLTRIYIVHLQLVLYT
jgi:hypothetical protein